MAERSSDFDPTVGLPSVKELTEARGVYARAEALATKEYDPRIEPYKGKFGVLMIAAPHIATVPLAAENRSSVLTEQRWQQRDRAWKQKMMMESGFAMFPGEATPMLYANLLIAHKLRGHTFAKDGSGYAPDVSVILNHPLFNDQFLRALHERLTVEKPKVVAISNLSEAHPYALEIARIVKRRLPQSIVVFGGQHETYTNPKELDKHVEKDWRELPSGSQVATINDQLRTFGTAEEQRIVDFVLSGQGEYGLEKLLEIVGSNPDITPTELKRLVIREEGTFSKRVRGKGWLHTVNPDTLASPDGRREIADISFNGREVDRNGLPFMDRRLLAMENRYPVFVDEHGIPLKTAQLMHQFGCSSQCSFCHESTTDQEFKHINKDPRSILLNHIDVREAHLRSRRTIAEMRLLHEEGYRAAFFDDSTFTQSEYMMSVFLPLLIEERKQYESRGEPYFQWGCQTTLPSAKEDILQKMAEAGCTYVYFGVESLNAKDQNVQKTRQPIRTDNVDEKNLPWDQLLELRMAQCKKFGIRVGVSLQFGLRTDETKEDREATIDMMAKLGVRGYLAPGSVAINLNSQYPGSKDWYHMLTGGNPRQARTVAEFDQLNLVDQERSLKLTKAEFDQLPAAVRARVVFLEDDVKNIIMQLKKRGPGQLPPDYRTPLVRHKAFETATSQSSWTAFEAGKIVDRLLPHFEKLKASLQQGELSTEELTVLDEKLKRLFGLHSNEDAAELRRKIREEYGTIHDLFRDAANEAIRERITNQATRRTFAMGDEVIRYAFPRLGPALIGSVHYDDPLIEGMMTDYKKRFRNDRYYDAGFAAYQERYYRGDPNPGINLNSSSLSLPFHEARAHALEVYKTLLSYEELVALEQSGTDPARVAKEHEYRDWIIYPEARMNAAELMYFWNESGDDYAKQYVALASNTTEAIGLVYWLAGFTDNSEQNVVLSTSENVSTKRAFELHMDHGNKDGLDGWSAYPSFGLQAARKRGGLSYGMTPDGHSISHLKETPTNIEVRATIDVLDTSIQQIKNQLRQTIDVNTQLLVLSHVVRDNGRELPVRELCRYARQLKAEVGDGYLQILIDGAQALGNLESVEFYDLGCDFYVATPHKTMKSEVVGLLYMNPANPHLAAGIERLKGLNVDQQVLRAGMFDEKLGIKPNIVDDVHPADVAGFNVAAHKLRQDQLLRSGDFWLIHRQREQLKTICRDLLAQLGEELKRELGYDVIEVETVKDQTSFILNFKLKNFDGSVLKLDDNDLGQTLSQRQLVMDKLQEKKVYISLINRTPDNESDHRYRVSFQVDNSEEEIREFAALLKQAIIEAAHAFGTSEQPLSTQHLLSLADLEA